MERLLRDNLLGALLVSRGFISEDQLSLGLQVQEREGGWRKLGDILQDLGYVNADQLREALRVQRRMSEEVIQRLESPRPEMPRPDPGQDALLVYFRDPDEGARWTRILWEEGYVLDLLSSYEVLLRRLQQRKHSLLLLEIANAEALRIPHIAARLDPDLVSVAVVEHALYRRSRRSLWAATPYYILRPFEQDELLLVVGKALERRRMILENRSLRSQVERHGRELALLTELSSRLLLADDLLLALNQGMEWLVDISDSQAGSLVMVDQRSGKLSFSAIFGAQADALRPILLQLGRQAFRLVAQTGEPLLIANLCEDNRFPTVSGLLAGFEPYTVLYAPLQVMGEVIGLIGLIRGTAQSPFTPWDQRLLVAVATLLGDTLARVHLYQEEED
ncbi:MAG: GAF domain-containing protein [Chloroflexia bacterium]|nr:GAF domain-containing protein [Chloroflexia bacterium]